jgi:hypothetical protein
LETAQGAPELLVQSQESTGFVDLDRAFSRKKAPTSLNLLPAHKRMLHSGRLPLFFGNKK